MIALIQALFLKAYGANLEDYYVSSPSTNPYDWQELMDILPGREGAEWRERFVPRKQI